MVSESGAGPRLIQHQLPLKLVVGVYGIMTLVAVALSFWLRGAAPVDVGTRDVPLWASILAGLLVGGIVVRASDVFTTRSAAMRRMALKLRAMVGRVTPPRAAVIGVWSGVGEELLFRGFLFPYLAELAVGWGATASVAWGGAAVVSSAAFGLAHQSGERDLRLWPLFAFVVGLVFAALTWWTGAVIAAVVAHFAINTLNLLALQDVRAT